ncbi:DUF262 domain-containing protein [Chryseobacterium lacus]|uniref:DUF262 domain-containing protein n=1 Tax=Chryseobacterium lacus TaxID=2058346 RepID=UPI000F88C561|nr:DUF262 domain-containing protein [Chryseobacterium lacus]RST27609.1 DUF262 domain-containing protein [Chryseobacterium lacus]
MEVNNTYTFWSLITKKKINIPIIQRDYAQGRINEEEKRNRFLTNIKEHIENNRKLHLDFVYGKEANGFFYPIDGQQRLTTLFLIHWYFSLKEQKKCPKELLRFEYDTRISSREFCKAIVTNEIVLPITVGDNSFINSLKNKNWFVSSWETDPTISAMLVMIQAIHDFFHDVNVSNVFDLLTKDELITFECLNLGAKGFDLTDELYIKMNARGKQLTTFENFKANFIQLIEKYYKDKKLSHPIKGEISYSGYFSYRIEKEWTDLFWYYRGDKTIIDNEFFNYFEFITQMCYFIEHTNVNVDNFTNHFSQYEQVYSKEEHLLFLFNSLDKLYEIHKHTTLESMFSTVINQDADYNKVTLFWNNFEYNNLFKQIISSPSVKSEDARTKIILFNLLQYLVFNNDILVFDDLREYLRISRNLLQARRQKNNTKYNTNVRINDFGNYWKLFSQLLVDKPYDKLLSNKINNKGTDISDQSLTNEIEKAQLRQKGICLNKLEEFKYLGGLLQQLLQFINTDNINQLTESIYEIWSDAVSDSLKIKALIASGFEGVYVKDTKMGESWYFGKKENWDYILTNDDQNISGVLQKLILEYSQKVGDTESRLREIIQDWLSVNTHDRSWKYYFTKYVQFLSNLNYFVWDNDYNLRSLGTDGSNPLVAYHINPYVLTICKLINDKTICNEHDCYLQYSGTSPLKLRNGLEMYCEEEGWRIMKESINLEGNILSKFNIEEYTIHYLLKDTNDKDRIEIAIDFINDVKSSN